LFSCKYSFLRYFLVKSGGLSDVATVTMGLYKELSIKQSQSSRSFVTAYKGRCTVTSLFLLRKTSFHHYRFEVKLKLNVWSQENGDFGLRPRCPNIGRQRKKGQGEERKMVGARAIEVGEYFRLIKMAEAGCITVTHSRVYNLYTILSSLKSFR
jgi:hypothetical protein